MDKLIFDFRKTSLVRHVRKTHCERPMIFTDGDRLERKTTVEQFTAIEHCTIEFDLVVIGPSCMHEKVTVLVVARLLMRYGTVLTSYCLKHNCSFNICSNKSQLTMFILGEIIVRNFYIT